MMDSLGKACYRQSSMPFLNQMEMKGIYKVVYEAQVPLFVFNTEKLPPASYFDYNYKLAACLFPVNK